MAGTPMPVPRQQFFDNNGDPLAGGLLYAYLAGTTTPADTYANVSLTTPNANPVVLDSSGRATIYLDALSYKFELKTSAGVSVWSQDNVPGVPGFGSASDVSGVAGENIAARDAVYISDGSVAMGGAGTAGKWMRLNSTTYEKSVTPYIIGVAPAAITSGATGSIRVVGIVTGFSGLTTGAPYFSSSSAGAITSSRPQNSRMVGVAISTTELMVVGESRQTTIDTWELPIQFGGSQSVGRSDTSYPAGSSGDKVVPNGIIQRFAMSRLPPGVYKLRGMVAGSGGATGTAALYNLTDNVELGSIASTATTGASLESSAITITHADTTEKDYGVKLKTSNAANPAWAWGLELFRETF